MGNCFDYDLLDRKNASTKGVIRHQQHATPGRTATANMTATSSRARAPASRSHVTAKISVIVNDDPASSRNAAPSAGDLTDVAESDDEDDDDDDEGNLHEPEVDHDEKRTRAAVADPFPLPVPPTAPSSPHIKPTLNTVVPIAAPLTTTTTVTLSQSPPAPPKIRPPPQATGKDAAAAAADTIIAAGPTVVDIREPAGPGEIVTELDPLRLCKDILPVHGRTYARPSNTAATARPPPTAATAPASDGTAVHAAAVVAAVTSNGTHGIAAVN